MSNPPPAGWYPDERGGQRWWDGATWTDHYQGPTPGQDPASPGQVHTITNSAPSPPKRSRAGLWVALGVVALVLVGLVLLIATLLSTGTPPTPEPSTAPEPTAAPLTFPAEEQLLINSIRTEFPEWDISDLDIVATGQAACTLATDNAPLSADLVATYAENLASQFAPGYATASPEEARHLEGEAAVVGEFSTLSLCGTHYRAWYDAVAIAFADVLGP